LDASTLYKEGKLTEAIASLNADVRKAPNDVQRRTFLFELLCFAGELERAQKQLSMLVQADPEASLGIMSYQQVIRCEADRSEMFATGALPESLTAVRPVRGRLNGEPFDALEDGDPRIGARLELFVGGQYQWIPFEHLSSIRMEPPRRARDLIWITATVVGGDVLDGADFGEALIPALTPLAHRHPDDLVRLGRVTEWSELQDGTETPIGQKMLLVDGDDFPILEVREIEIEGPSTAAD
jgi:type VI secretion system protein ImpE